MGRKSKRGRNKFNRPCYKDQTVLHKERHPIPHRLSWMRKSPTEGKNESTIVISKEHPNVVVANTVVAANIPGPNPAH